MKGSGSVRGSAIWWNTSSQAARPRNVAKGASGHQTLTVKDVLQGALKLPIDSRRDGDQEYIGAIDNLGQRTPSAAFGHDLLIGNKQYTSSRFRGLCDMRVRLWAKENGYEMENPVDSMSNKPSGKPRAGTEDVHVHGKEERDEEDLFPATYWPPPPFNIFNRSERKDVQEVLSKSPDLPRNVPHELISFEQQVCTVYLYASCCDDTFKYAFDLLIYLRKQMHKHTMPTYIMLTNARSEGHEDLLQDRMSVQQTKN